MTKIPVECYTRVVGFYRPMNTTNPGKRAEITDRVYLKYEERLYENTERAMEPSSELIAQL